MSQINDLRAKYNTKGNAVIPNTFQHPNIFIDRLMHYLSPEENTVLTFAVRRILGFQSNIMSRKDNISLSQFTDGIQSENGEFLSHGCGLGTDTVRKCLENLSRFFILVQSTEKPDPRKGQEYWLQDNENNIDWQGLENRKNEQKQVEYKRTQKARCTVAQKARGTVAQDSTVLSDSTDVYCGTETQNPLETHPETQRNPLIAPDGAKPLSLEWQIGAGLEIITIPEVDEFSEKAHSWAALIAMNNADLESIAFEFMVSANKLPIDDDIKFWRKTFRGFRKRGANDETMRRAVTKHLLGKLPIKSPRSIEWAVIEILQPAPHNQTQPQVSQAEVILLQKSIDWSVT